MSRANLTGEQIRLAFAEGGSGQRFEEFFRLLLERERELRHVVGTTRISGPMKFGVGDGGKDSAFEVCEQPRISRRKFVEPLTWDEIGKTYYSLKTGTNWEAAVIKDVGYHGDLSSPGKTKKKSTTTITKKKKPPTKRKPPVEELLEHISSGNRYVIVTSEPAGDGTELLKKVEAAFRYWLEDKKLAIPSDLTQNLSFRSANEIACFIRTHKPILSTQVERQLGLTAPEGLFRWNEWTAKIERERADYEEDEPRRNIVSAIREPDSPRVIHIFGPPGVGKTRVVHYALERGQTDAVHYTNSPALGGQVVKGDWIKDAGAVILVVDEVASSDARSLASDFLACAPSGQNARLILIGVSDSEARAREGIDSHGQEYGIHLEELSSTATQNLIMTELGTSAGQREALVQRVLDLADGYPWFAILLARALLDDEDALASGDDEANRWGAAMRVLVGNRSQYQSEAHWQREAVIRAKCLLVVIMTGDLDLSWDDVWTEHGNTLREAIDEPDDWSRVKRAAGSCFDREILRQVGRSNRRYISPANLTRIILNHFFCDGPDDLGPRVVRCAPAFQARLQTQAARCGVIAQVRDKLTQSFWGEFRRRAAAREPLTELLKRADTLHAAAKRMPEQAATAVTRAILDLEPTELADAKALRHSLRGLLQELVQERLPESTFAQLEDALFRMACVEDERWANNATGIWASLSLVALSQTPQSWSFRFQLLTRRCLHGTVEARRLALSGLAGAVRAQERAMGYSGAEWAMPEEAEYNSRKREAWCLLLGVGASTEVEVAARARQIIVAELRGCVADGVAVDVDIIERLTASVSSWSVEQRRELSEILTHIQRYEQDQLPPELVTVLAALSKELQPSDFRERLVSQVGSWHPGPWAINDEQREQYELDADIALVSEALRQPQHLRSELSWLSTDRARRQRAFVRTLGRLDSHRIFLSSIEAFVSSHRGDRPLLLSWYVEGWALAHDKAGADVWLARQLDAGEHDEAAIFVLPFLEPNDQRLSWLVELVEHGRAQPQAMSVMYRRWVEGSSPVLMCRLLEAMSCQPELVHVGVSLAYELLRCSLELDVLTRAVAVAGTLVLGATHRHMASVREYDWERLVLELADVHSLDTAVDAVLLLLASTTDHGNTSLGERVLRALFERGHATRVWTCAGPHLEGERGVYVAWQFARARLLSKLDPALVLSWVRDRESRALIVAQLVNPYGPQLPEVARRLLQKFGAQGPVASSLAARAFSTPRAVPSLIDFKRRQRENALKWSTDELANVRQWGREVSEHLSASINDARAHEEFERKFA
jgi:hypothetical protein